MTMPDNRFDGILTQLRTILRQVAADILWIWHSWHKPADADSRWEQRPP